MKKQLTSPVQQTHTIADDGFEPITVVINQMRQGELILFTDEARTETRWEDGTPTVINRTNVLREQRKLVYLTLGSVLGFTRDTDDKEVFRSKEGGGVPRVSAAMPEDEFNDAWDMLDPDLADQIVRFVLMTNPLLRPVK